MLKVWLSCVDVKSDSILIYQRECSAKCFRRIVFKGTSIRFSLINSYVKWIHQPRQYYSINFAGVRNARVSAQTVLGRLLLTNPEIGWLGPNLPTYFCNLFVSGVTKIFEIVYYFNLLLIFWTFYVWRFFFIFNKFFLKNLWKVHFFLLLPLNHNLNVPFIKTCHIPMKHQIISTLTKRLHCVVILTEFIALINIHKPTWRHLITAPRRFRRDIP